MPVKDASGNSPNQIGDMASTELFTGRSPVAITPSDTVDLAIPVRAIYVGTTGNIALVPPNKTAAVLFSNVQAGTTLMVAAKRINATNTTASNLVGLH